MRQSEAVQAHLNQLSIICGAIVSGVLVFAVVVWYLLSSGSMPPADLELPSWMGTLTNLVALVALIKAVLLPRLIGAPAAGAPEEAFISWHKKVTIVGFALRDGATLIALVGAMLTGQLAGAAVLVGLAVLSMVMAWPRADQMGKAGSA